MLLNCMYTVKVVFLIDALNGSIATSFLAENGN